MYRVARSTLIEQLKSDNGIARALNATVTIDGERRQHRDAAEFAETLRSFRDDAETSQIHELYNYQVCTAVNLVYRPGELTVTRPQTVHDLSTRVVSSYPYSDAEGGPDIGSIALNDMLVGSGKTLVSMLAGIRVATRRREEIRSRGELLMREQATNISWLTGVHDRAPPDYEDTILVFAPRHLTSQWERAARQALGILSCAAEVLVNPLAASLTAKSAAGQLVVAIYDNLKKLPRHVAFVPCVIVDEFTVKGDHNFVARSFADGKTVYFGRLIVVGADAGNVGRILMGLRNACLLKKWAQIHAGSWSYSSSIAHMAGASSLSTDERSQIAASMGLNTPILLHSIRYVPSVTGILFGSVFEISQQSGATHFSRMGVDVRDCTTTDDILAAVQARLAAPPLDALAPAVPDGRITLQQALAVAQDRRVRETLTECVHRMARYSHGALETCPICYEDMAESCIIQPCWHVICHGCMREFLRRQNQPCPLCRSTIRGHVTSAARAPRAAPSESPTFGRDLAASLSAWFAQPHGLFKTIVSLLLCLEHHARTQPEADAAFRVLIAIPAGIEFAELSGEFLRNVPPGAAWISHFFTVGTARNRITSNAIESQLRSFCDETGPKFKVLFTSEGSRDSMIGLDLPSIDCLISVGAGNELQRIGRLTRLGRKFSRGCVQHFDIQPT